MSNIPEAMRLIRKALELMPRERKQRPAPRTAAKLIPQIIASIKQLRRKYPQMPMREIGRRVGVDQGRVSEVLNGKR